MKHWKYKCVSADEWLDLVELKRQHETNGIPEAVLSDFDQEGWELVTSSIRSGLTGSSGFMIFRKEA